MAQTELKASDRKITGKGVRFLRRQQITPVHLFGHGLESLALQCETANLERSLSRSGETQLISLSVNKEKNPRPVLVREVQRNPITRRLLHVDFYQVSMEEKVEVEVPIVLVGQAPAMTIKDNTLLQALNTMTVECLPAKIPANIEVDISPLTEAGKSIRVKDITVNPDITVLTDPEQVVVIVTAARAEEVVAPPEAVAAPTEEVKKVEEKEKEKPEEA